MTVSEDLLWRGLIKDKTFSDNAWLDTPQTFYHGVDCSSDSLAIGNLATMLMARRLVEAGWKPVLLVGGATSLIGDPGGKNEERQLKAVTEIEHNVAAIQKQVSNLFKGADFTLVNNIDWFNDVKLLDFLRDYGKHFSMTELLQRDFISERMHEGGSGISYAEFSYTLIQGYDYLHLYKKYGATLQTGGSDQWGNMLSGVGIVRKKLETEVHALSMPLVINKQTGHKFGKSESGAIWLDAAKTSPYSFYQFWLNVDDHSVIDYLKIYTFLSKQQVDELQDSTESNPQQRLAQKALAYEVTAIVHGTQIADSIRRISETLFGDKAYSELSEEDFSSLKNELPTVRAIAEQTSLVDLLVSTGLASSNGEARRFLGESSVYINGLQFSSDKHTLSTTDAIAGHVLIRRGKNTQAIIELNT